MHFRGKRPITRLQKLASSSAQPAAALRNIVKSRAMCTVVCAAVRTRTGNQLYTRRHFSHAPHDLFSSTWQRLADRPVFLLVPLFCCPKFLGTYFHNGVSWLAGMFRTIEFRFPRPSFTCQRTYPLSRTCASRTLGALRPEMSNNYIL